VLMPGRYAKFEESSGLIASIDRYAYVAPRPVAAVMEEAEAPDTAEPEEPDSLPELGPELESVREENQEGAASAG